MKNLKTSVSIEVNGEKEVMAVLKKLESMGYKWCSGHKPTEHVKHNAAYIKMNIINVSVSTKMVSYSTYNYADFTRITAAEFLSKNECIVIYRKGSETIALDKTTGKKAVAKCSPEDKYDFMTGAKLAFERLTEVREVKRHAKVGEYVKVTDNRGHRRKIGDIFKVTKVESVGNLKGWVRGSERMGDLVRDSQYVVLEGYQPPQEKEPEFKPYMTYKGEHYGYIGEPTPLKDAIGRALEVGDTVELYNKYNEYKGECAVCRHADENYKAFVYGIALHCEKDGTIINGWKIIFKRKHKDVAHGEVVDDIKYVKERAKHE